MDQKRLVRLFEKLGAKDPEGWAKSQIEEGIPQLHRFLFLRQAWKQILEEKDEAWVSNVISRSRKNPDAPFSDLGRIVGSIHEKGISQRDLNVLVRCIQAESLFRFCYLLQDPGELEEEIEGVSWGLFETDEEGNPIQEIGGLHESVLEMDPTGREMRGL